MKPMIEVIEEMITEQGDSWLHSYSGDRALAYHAVVITDNPERCWRLTHDGTQWRITQSTLGLAELADFFAAFGSHWQLMFGSRFMAGTSEGERPYQVRAFIKNGRKRTQRWSVSIGKEQLTSWYLSSEQVKAA